MVLNINFKMLSLNVRRIRSFEKLKALFQWLKKENADIIFLQETYSTPEVEQIWKSQWRGEMFFGHGATNSRGVLVLVKESLDCEIKVCKQDNEGRFIMLTGNVQGQSLFLVNIYAPNKNKEQCVFYDEIQKEIDQIQDIDPETKLIIGVDFNLILDSELDGSGGKPKVKDACTKFGNLCNNLDLTDIWRIRNPDVKRFSWRQKNPTIQRRLDFWLISNCLQEEVEKVDITPAIRSDHSAITLQFKGMENLPHGPSFWKFNASLLEDEEYIAKINEKYSEWIEECKEIKDPRVYGII